MSTTSPDSRGSRLGPVSLALIVAVILISAVLKLTLDAGGRLWLDEGWTLGIVEQPTWARFFEQLRLDVNPPLYFTMLRGWTGVFGTSNGALRGFSTLFAMLLPAAALLPGVGDPRTRWTWAAFLALWPAGVEAAQEVRGYALLACLAAAQTALFAHLLARPSRARATAWVATAALSALTHHHAALLAGAQGLALLLRERQRVLRLWPAILAFAPALAWEALQAPRVLLFARPEFAWYSPANGGLLIASINAMAGPPVVFASQVAIAGAAAWLASREGHDYAPDDRERALRWAAGASLAGGVFVIALGFARASLTQRYLVAFAPGVLLIPALTLAPAGRWRGAARGAMLALSVFTLALHARGSNDTGRRAYQFETASADLAAAGAHRVAFLLDNPTNGALAPVEREALGGAFFVRLKHLAAIDGLALAPGEDPNARLVAATPPGGALLWIWDVRVPHTAAVRFPPRLEALAPDLSCRRYAYSALGVVACVRKPLGWTR